MYQHTAPLGTCLHGGLWLEFRPSLLLGKLLLQPSQRRRPGRRRWGCLFVLSGLTGESVLNIAGRAIPYVLAMLGVVLTLAFIPALSLWAL